LIKKI